jgi:hypothetical protein
MHLRLSVAVFLMSVLSVVLGASVSVNSTELSKNGTNLDNSTKSLNDSEISFKIREADLVVNSI